MIELENSELRIELLDPIADAARLGARFCGGGFVWQVYDNVLGPLLSGPEFPKSDPVPFNGQGLPESFRHRTLDGQSLTWRGTRGVALGAGELRLDASGTVELVAPCSWEITPRICEIEFAARQSVVGFETKLVRRIELDGRTLLSHTRLTNLATGPLVLEWFVHPFFPLVDGLIGAEIARDASLPDNPGFCLRDGQLTQKRRFTSPQDGHMERGLRLPTGQIFRATLAHPRLDYIQFETDFVPSAHVIWGNDRTFSFEPYLALNLAAGETREWNVLYRFGPNSGMSAPVTSSRTVSRR